MALSKEDRQAFAHAKYAALKSALKLTPAQEKNWPTLETAFLDVAKARLARSGEVWQTRVAQKKQGLDLPARLKDRAKGLRARADQVDKIAEAAKPLLDSLDDAQKRRFGLMLRSFSRRRTALRQRAKVVRRLKKAA
jgi:hypothetical protein